MSLYIQNEDKNKITEFASKIVSDWFAKIKNEVQLSSNKSSLPSYSILLANKQYVLDSQKMLKFDLAVVLQNSQLSPAHLLSLSGQLSTFGQNQKQFVPQYVAQLTIANSIAIFAMQYYFQIVKNNAKLQSYQNSRTLYNQNKEGRSKIFIHQLNCIDCLKYYGAFNVSAKQNGFMSAKKGQNILDGGAPFYAIYPTKQGLLAIGNLQPKFYEEMIDQLQLSSEEKQLCFENQLNVELWPQIRKILAGKFKQKTAQQWQNVMNKRDTCVTAVQDIQKIHQKFLHPYLLKPKM